MEPRPLAACRTAADDELSGQAVERRTSVSVRVCLDGAGSRMIYGKQEVCLYWVVGAPWSQASISKHCDSYFLVLPTTPTFLPSEKSPPGDGVARKANTSLSSILDSLILQKFFS